MEAAYRIGEEIITGYLAWARLGGGQCTDSWLAWSLAHQAPVVVKVARADQSGSRRPRTWLAREVDHLARLAHPALQRLLAYNLDTARPYLVVDYIEGPTLSTVLAEAGPLDPTDVVRLGIQLAAVLHYLHGADAVHLDLKPDNVALREGRPVLLDLGLARPIGHVPKSGTSIGTAATMAPEQIRGEPVHPAMDLFALGAVLYHAVGGAPPFPGASRERRCYPQLHGPVAPLQDRAPGCPDALARLIHQLLAADPGERPGSALDAVARLEATLPPGQEGVRPPWSDTPALQPV